MDVQNRTVKTLMPKIQSIYSNEWVFWFGVDAELRTVKPF
jgi:hypothetical protein